MYVLREAWNGVVMQKGKKARERTHMWSGERAHEREKEREPKATCANFTL